MTNTTTTSSNHRGHGMRAGDPISQQSQHDAAVGREMSPSRWRAKRSPVASIDCTNETTSTATTITEPSHDPLTESHMMRTRTNFGDYQFYVPPETACSPYRSPVDPPVSPQRDTWSSPESPDRKVPQRLNLPLLPTSPERAPRENPDHATDPAPLDEKRMHFFDDAASGQIPFDQVWNQQEFTLDRKNSEDETDNQQEQRSLGSQTSKPFDEEPPQEEVGSNRTTFNVGSSSAVAPPPPPPLPPTMRKHHKKQTLSPGNRVAALSQEYEKRIASGFPSDADIPSDEDETERNRGNPKTSLATASRRVTAETVGRRKSAEDLSCPGSPTRSDTDAKSVDSLFDFQKGKRSSSAKALREWRQNPPPDIVSSEDEASLNGDNDDSSRVKGLRTRTQEAFATRKRLSPKKTSPPRPVSPRTLVPRKGIAAVPRSELDGQVEGDEPAVPTAPGPRVSFTATNTVHHFQHEYDMYSDHGDSSVGTYEEKTIGQDVEEAFKDIFMLTACNPSPRQIRYHSDTRFEQRETELSDNSDEDSGTGAKSDDDDESVKDTPESRKASSREILEEEELEEKLKSVHSVEGPNEGEDIFLEAMLSVIEGGLGSMSAAFGFASRRSTDTVAETERERDSSENERDIKSRSGPTSADESTPPKAPRKNEKSRSSSKHKDRDDAANARSVQGVYDSMSNYIMGPEQSQSYEDLESSAPQDEREYDSKKDLTAPPESEEDGPRPLEHDPHLLELAKQSAICMHEILGVRYDESSGVDISDVKFVVVVLSLPLGIIFQEDYSGCWITKVIPEGNADRSGKIEAGDQLAAINGASSVGMKVDDICAVISAASSEADSIELTFLRYIGPFRPLESDGASLTQDDASLGIYPLDDLMVEDEKPSSTISIVKPDESKPSKKEPSPKSPKRGVFRKKFKWLSRGKKSQATTKAE